MSKTNGNQALPESLQNAVLMSSEEMPSDSKIVKGYDFSKGLDYTQLFDSYRTTGLQASSLGNAIDEVNRMINWRLSDEEITPDEDDDLKILQNRSKVRCKIFLAYTSNMVSSGVREIIRYLVQNKMVDYLVTSAGGVEEDFIKCYANTYMGDFHLDGRTLRKKGLNRIGNMLVPNENYCKFEDWLKPILDQMLIEQNTQNIVWTPSKMIHRLGKEINHPDSIYYWAYKNDIPVFCPALTDGSLGDMLYFHTYQNPGLILDIIGDIRRINDYAMRAKRTGMIILGGGIVKHHTCNANLMRNGAEYSVYINTAQEFDGSDAGARPDEAISWGKIKMTAKPVKVYSDASLVFPILVAETFFKNFKPKEEN